MGSDCTCRTSNAPSYDSVVVSAQIETRNDWTVVWAEIRMWLASTLILDLMLCFWEGWTVSPLSPVLVEVDSTVDNAVIVLLVWPELQKEVESYVTVDMVWDSKLVEMWLESYRRQGPFPKAKSYEVLKRVLAMQGPLRNFTKGASPWRALAESLTRE